MKKRFLVLILLLLIALALPLLASAETQSGTCGDNLTWTLTDSGVLTISGTGPMEDFDTAKWSNKGVKYVLIENGVTRIGNQAFMDCGMINGITIPDR